MKRIRDTYTEGKLLPILKILSNSPKPLGSVVIANELASDSIFLCDRAVRYYLAVADECGFTRLVGRKGRIITEAGLDEVKDAIAPKQFGSIRDKLEITAFQTTFVPEKRTGKLPVNISFIEKNEFREAILAMKNAIDAGICVSNLIAIASEGESLGGVVIPSGKIGFATICSVVLNGILLKAGVPIDYKLGGVLLIVNSEPVRFVATIDYGGTSLDPSRQFINNNMTSVSKAARTGSGRILGLCRTIPAVARGILDDKIAVLREVSINCVYAVGKENEPIAGIPIGLNRIGILQVSGLNPVAAAVESGICVENMPESVFIDFEQLQSFGKLYDDFYI